MAERRTLKGVRLLLLGTLNHWLIFKKCYNNFDEHTFKKSLFRGRRFSACPLGTQEKPKGRGLYPAMPLVAASDSGLPYRSLSALILVRLADRADSQQVVPTRPWQFDWAAGAFSFWNVWYIVPAERHWISFDHGSESRTSRGRVRRRFLSALPARLVSGPSPFLIFWKREGYWHLDYNMVIL